MSAIGFDNELTDLYLQLLATEFGDDSLKWLVRRWINQQLARDEKPAIGHQLR
jgi:hypothetical protein